MKFSRRHYVPVAGIFRSTYAKFQLMSGQGASEEWKRGADWMHGRIYEEFLELFASDNPNFNLDKFMAAVWDRRSIVASGRQGGK